MLVDTRGDRPILQVGKLSLRTGEEGQAADNPVKTS